MSISELTHTLIWLTGLVLATPLVATIVDIVRHHVPFSARALWTGYVRYGFRVLFLLVVQFGAILVLFLLGPVWFFMLFLTIADLVLTRWMPGAVTLGVPVLCNWFRVASPYCIYVLIAYHVISAILAYLVFRYGHRCFDAASSWYQCAIQRIAERLQDERMAIPTE